MGLRDKKRNQRRVLSRRSAGPKTGEGKDFLVRARLLALEPNRTQHKGKHPHIRFVLVPDAVL